jgi:N-acyl-D-amino-acid deacylase
MYDVVIKNALIADGTGSATKKADVGVKGNKIAFIGLVNEQEGKKVVSGEGKVLTPGFIDVLNHADTNWMLFRFPEQASMLMQGVTTIIGGNCGSSLAPLVQSNSLLSIQKWAHVEGANVNWQSFEELMEELQHKRFGVNIGSLVGHSTMRRGIIGEETRDLSQDEIKKMQYLTERSIAEGALGLSFGLAFAHARSATIQELIALASSAKKAGAVVAGHLRNEGERFIDALNEAVDIMEGSEASFEISHLKAHGAHAAEYLDFALGKIGAINKAGGRVNFDVFPYDFSASVLYTVLPEWVTEGGKKNVLERLRKPEIQKIVKEDLRERNIEYDDIIIASAHVTKNYVGKSILDIAEREGMQPEDALIQILIANDDKVIAFFKYYLSANIEKLITHPNAIITSDGFGVGKEVFKEGVLVHPRCFGAFPRAIEEYVINKKILSIEGAIRKMTGLPAEKYGIRQRGFIREGYYADMVLIDLGAAGSKASIEDPFIAPSGIECVLVNGVVAVEKNVYTGALAGRVVTKG